MNSLPDKTAFRQKILGQRRRLGHEQVEADSRRLSAWVTGLAVFQCARHVMMYLAMPDEPQTDGLITAALAEGKTISVPHLRQEYGIMDAAVIRDLDNLVIGRLGLKMPKPASLELADPRSLDVVLVPGVAFDTNGHRIGMGAGYYDRFLMNAVNAYKIGIAWSFQVVSAIPNLPHDIPMDCLITEEGIVFCR